MQNGKRGEQNGRLTSSVVVILKIAPRRCGRPRRALGGQRQVDIFALAAAARHETLALKCNVSVVVWLHNSGWKEDHGLFIYLFQILLRLDITIVFK